MSNNISLPQSFSQIHIENDVCSKMDKNPFIKVFEAVNLPRGQTFIQFQDSIKNCKKTDLFVNVNMN